MKWEIPKLNLLNKTNETAQGVAVCDAGYGAYADCFQGSTADVACDTGGAYQAD